MPQLDAKALHLRARFVGSRLRLRDLERGEVLALHPLSVRAGEQGLAVLFRFGAVVLIDVGPVEEAAFFSALAPFVEFPFEQPESEELMLVVDPAQRERMQPDGTLTLQQASLDRLQVVAEVLAKSMVLAHYEARVSQVFDRIEPLAEQLRRGARGRGRGRELLRQIGDVLLTQARTVGRVEVTEKPERTWDDPGLDRLYEHLAVEYELRDRDLGLSRKLEVVSRTVETYLNLLHNRRTLRVEWYIVILIAFEIALVLYDRFAR
jgi:required for meiotic nuclear division protein 1